MTTIVTLQNATKEALPLIGEKAVTLALLNEHMNVPPAIILTNNAFKRYLEETGIKKRIDLLRATRQNTSEDHARLAQEIQELVMETSIPQQLFEEIKEAYYALSISKEQSLNELMQQEEESCVAVRPSPIKYHGSNMHTSIVNIRGPQRLHRAILLCWASFYSADALEAREQNKSAEYGFAVILQKMIDAQAAGELHTQYKMNADEVLIRACKGLGTALSSGRIAADKYFITKSNLAVANIEIGKQTFMLERDIDTDKTTKVYLQDAYANKQKIADRFIAEITLHSKKIEELLAKPQIVDFAIYKDTIYILGSKVPQWFYERLQKQEREKEEQKKRLEEMQPASPQEVEAKKEEISSGILSELDKDTLVTSALEPTQEAEQEPKSEPEKEQQPTQVHEQKEAEKQMQQEQATREAENQEKTQQQERQENMQQESPQEPGPIVREDPQNSIQDQSVNQTQQVQQEQQEPQELQGHQQETEEEQKAAPAAKEEVPAYYDTTMDKHQEEKVAQETTAPMSFQEIIKQRVTAMTNAVQEIQQATVQPITKEEELEEKEEQMLSKVREQKGEVDINDLVLSIDPESFEKELEEQQVSHVATSATEATKEVVAPQVEQMPRSQIVTETVADATPAPVTPTIVKNAQEQEEATQEQVVNSEKPSLTTQEPGPVQKELSPLEKAAGSVIIQCFKQAKEQIPQEEWASNPTVRQLAVLANNYLTKKVAPTKDEVHSALSAIEKINRAD